MTRSLDVRRSLALTGALVVATWGAAALPASADTGSGRSAGHAHAATGQDQGKDAAHGHGHGDKGDATPKQTGSHGHGGTHDSNDTHGSNGGTHGGKGGTHGGKGGAHGDPAGNNGTVKIAPLGEMDGIPQNSPHPGCTFQVEWYGFDEGADIVSTVGFAMKAPTADVGLGVDGPSSVFVGGDPASGAGTDTGLDGVQSYTLSFDGAPHPKQGYHVKLTVHTPRSKGNDTKTKVFWVAPCEAAQAGTGETPAAGGTGGTSGDTGSDTTEVSGAGAGDDIEVLGAQASAAPNGVTTDVSAAQAAGAKVPTAVDAGEGGPQSVMDWVSSPLPIVVIGLGALLAAAALVARRRSRVHAG